MLMNFARRLCRPALLTGATLALAAGGVAAQDGAGPTETEPTAAYSPWTPQWTESDIGALADQLTGTWMTAEPVGTTEAGEVSNIMMMISAVPIDGLDDTVLIETYRTDDMVNPYRVAAGQFYRRRGDIRLRTFELALPDSQTGALAGFAAVPELFPEISADDMIATMDITLFPTSTGFTGRSPYPYPTAKGGAVEMTASLEINGDRLTTVERGYAADGSVAWGADEEGKYEFRRVDSPYRIEQRDNGLVIIDVQVPEGEPVANGDRLHVHYSGWLVDTMRFDTSRQEGRDVFVFPYPPRLIQGWNEGLNDVTTGTIRKLIIPGDLAYGPRGQPRANIPGDATLYFTMEIILVEKPAAAPTEPAMENEAEPVAPTED
jgi:hypothetical protein